MCTCDFVTEKCMSLYAEAMMHAVHTVLTVGVCIQAYAVSVTRLIMKDTPHKAAVLAASILSELKYENAPHAIMLKVKPHKPRTPGGLPSTCECSVLFLYTRPRCERNEAKGTSTIV